MIVAWKDKLKSLFVFGGRKIIPEIGAVSALDRKNLGWRYGHKTLIKVSLLEEKETAERSLGIEIVYKGIGCYRTSPIVLSKQEAQELMELLRAAVQR